MKADENGFIDVIRKALPMKEHELADDDAKVGRQENNLPCIWRSVMWNDEVEVWEDTSYHLVAIYDKKVGSVEVSTGDDVLRLGKYVVLSTYYVENGPRVYKEI